MGKSGVWFRKAPIWLWLFLAATQIVNVAVIPARISLLEIAIHGCPAEDIEFRERLASQLMNERAQLIASVDPGASVCGGGAMEMETWQNSSNTELGHLRVTSVCYYTRVAQPTSLSHCIGFSRKATPRSSSSCSGSGMYTPSSTTSDMKATIGQPVEK